MSGIFRNFASKIFGTAVEHICEQPFGHTSVAPKAKASEIVTIGMAQIGGGEIVPFEMAQIPNVVFATGWTNHQIILSRCKTDEERLFYMLYAKRERLENKQLEFYLTNCTNVFLLKDG